jgi:hypothetical protein
MQYELQPGQRPNWVMQDYVHKPVLFLLWHGWKSLLEDVQSFNEFVVAWMLFFPLVVLVYTFYLVLTLWVFFAILFPCFIAEGFLFILDAVFYDILIRTILIIEYWKASRTERMHFVRVNRFHIMILELLRFIPALCVTLNVWDLKEQYSADECVAKRESTSPTSSFKIELGIQVGFWGIFFIVVPIFNYILRVAYVKMYPRNNDEMLPMVEQG